MKSLSLFFLISFVLRIAVDSAECRLIVPGTKWCGKGDIASSGNDIGFMRHMDKCCRDHDNCKMSIPAGSAAFGLENPQSYTLSHCDCDIQFNECLRSNHGAFSNSLGKFYFNLMKPWCFREMTCPGCNGRYEIVTVPQYRPMSLREMWDKFVRFPFIG